MHQLGSIRYGISIFGQVMLIPYFTAYLMHYLYNIKTKFHLQKQITFLKSALKMVRRYTNKGKYASVYISKKPIAKFYYKITHEIDSIS